MDPVVSVRWVCDRLINTRVNEEDIFYFLIWCLYEAWINRKTIPQESRPSYLYAYQGSKLEHPSNMHKHYIYSISFVQKDRDKICLRYTISVDYIVPLSLATHPNVSKEFVSDGILVVTFLRCPTGPSRNRGRP